MSRNYLEINYRQLRDNIRRLQQHLPDQVQIMGVVKDNGYGTSAPVITRALVAEGVSNVAVATVEEALELRQLFPTLEILILGYFDLAQLLVLVEQRIAVTIFDLVTAQKVSARLREVGTSIVVHLKVDTGMGRLGFWYTDQVQELEALQAVLQLPHLDIQGIYSHFAVSDLLETETVLFTQRQIELYDEVISRLQYPFKDTHLSNSYGFLNYPHLPYSYVRLGILLLGCTSRDDIVSRHDNWVKPVISWKSSIIALKTYPPGTWVSYGRSYQTTTTERIAVVGVGYGDGYDRRLSNQFSVIIRDTLVPIVGRVCMDQMMVRVGDVPCAVGDEVILIGASEHVTLTVDDMARQLGTINNEVFCKIAQRVPRRVIYEDEVME